jgi:hypothetical protein
MLLVELINYVPLDHVFEKLDLENVLGVLQYGCADWRSSRIRSSMA